MKVEVGDVFTFESHKGQPRHLKVVVRITASAHGHFEGETLAVLERGDNKYVSTTYSTSKCHFFGPLKERLYETKRVSKTKYPEYFL